MNVLGYAQKIGQALMVPVAVLPAAAVLMGIGYWLDPDGWGANSQLAAFLIKSGGAIIDNMGLLFAVGVAFGLSKDKHGSAALSGLVGYYVVTTLLSPGSVAQLQHIDVSEVPAAFGKINNQYPSVQPPLVRPQQVPLRLAQFFAHNLTHSFFSPIYSNEVLLHILK